MRNPFKKYYFASGENYAKNFDCTIDIWFWQNPQDAVTDVLDMWSKKYGDVSIRSFTKL